MNAARTSVQAGVSVKKRRKTNRFLWTLFLPVIAYYIVFKYAPMLGTVIAFKEYTFFDGILGSPWVGLKNFETLFNNPQTVGIVRNTLVLSLLSIIVGFPFPILMAILLNEARKLWFKKSIQTLIYLPHFFSWVIVGGLVVTLFAEQSGVVNHLLKRIGAETFPFLYDETAWIAIFLGSGIWKEAGFSTIIFLAALSNIDPSLYEAAGMDGANKFRQIWHITLPGLSSTIVLILILSMGRVMEVGFDQIYMLKNPSVFNISEVISTYIYRVGVQGAQFSLTAAMGLFESVVGLILVVLTNAVARKFNQGLW